ncbi:MAG: cytochrome c oxidase subunit II [Rubellimicrobium sp.]|nr:cytochrome c oxidase subunit II [Rubellimicrobium sp.]
MNPRQILSGPGAVISAAVAVAVMAGAAGAQDAQPDPLGQLEIVGAPHAGGLGFQPAATELASDLHRFDDILLWIISAITILVTLLIIWVILRYNRKVNPVPARFSHNSPLEVTWTIVPILTLVFIGTFSLPVLFKQQEIPEADITIKVTGHQWYWEYEYVDQLDAAGNPLNFESYMLGSTIMGGTNTLDDEARAQLAELGYSESEFALATDTAVVVPVGAVVVMQVTGADVIHSWTIPAFGVKQDAVPGRLAQLWFSAEREGIYFGQCSELCGQAHAYMPITVKVVSPEAYAAWVDRVQTDSDYVMW